MVQNFNKILTPAGSSFVSDGQSTIALGQSASVDPAAVRVPEPAALAIFAAGATGLMARRRKICFTASTQRKKTADIADCADKT